MAAQQPNSAARFKIDAKVYLANERTFLTWMRQAVLIGSIGAAMSGLAQLRGYHPPGRQPSRGEEAALLSVLVVHGAGIALLLLAAGVALAAGVNWYRRGDMIRAGVGSDSPAWSSTWLPRLLTACLVGVVGGVWGASLVRTLRWRG